MNVNFYLSDSFACGHVRGVVPASEINRSWPNVRVTVKGDMYYCDYANTQVMVFQRQFRESPFFARAKERGIKVVYEVDDDLFQMPADFPRHPDGSSPYEFYSRPDVQANILRYLNESDAVLVSTPELAESLQARAPRQRFVVIPNSLDLGMWNPAYEMRRKAPRRYGPGSVVLGWHASGSHAIDAPLVGSVLADLMETYPFLHLSFIGWLGFEQFPGARLERFKDRITCQDWVVIDSLPYSLMEFDIGLAPLADRPFNRAKSNIKYLELSALGIPTVASPLPPYQRSIQHGVTGFLAEGNSPDAFRAALEELITSPARRESVGAAAREQLLNRWDVAHVAAAWVRAYEDILTGRLYSPGGSAYSGRQSPESKPSAQPPSERQVDTERKEEVP